MAKKVNTPLEHDNLVTLSTDAQNSIESITQQQLPYLLPQGMSRAKDLLPFLPFGITTLWNYTKAKKFPQPIKLSATVTAWRNADVIAWLENQTCENVGG